MPDIAQRLQTLGLRLPEPPRPVAAYIPFTRSGNLLFVSGQVPFVEGKVACCGAVPSAVSIEQARNAARQCALNGLAIASGALGGSLDRVNRIVRLGVWVCSDATFTDQPKVANGASELLVEIFGEAGRHARAAVGAIALPLGATVEVEMLLEVRD